MDFLDVVYNRSSIRSFSSDSISLNLLNSILEATNRAPSAGNLQAYDIYIVKNTNVRTLIAHAAFNQDFIAQAPIILIFCAHPAISETRYHERGARLYSIQDATIACTYAMLASQNLGLGTVWVGAFDENQIRNIIGVSEEIIPIAILPIGFAKEKPKERSRRELSDLVHWV